jgi:4-diphosphocytidyl-2-C-methyl-D-erythritol kinase
MPQTQAIHVFTPAKINLILRILDKRSDGYHNVWSVMETVGLVDELRLCLVPGLTGIRFRCDHPSVPADARNLVVRAAQAVLDRAAVHQGLDIQLQKRIPIGAGLGGGSSNAAGTIAGLNELLRLGWSREEQIRLGAMLGSDVPFFFVAPSAQVSGRGEHVSAFTIHGDRWVVLVNPGFAVDTGWAYAQLASRGLSAHPLSEPHRRLASRSAATWHEIIPMMENDFEAALAPTHAIFSDLKRRLLDAGAEAAMLSGSGSTVFGLFREERKARHAKAALAASDRETYAVRAGVPLVSDPHSIEADVLQVG